ncbi:MAG: hypothetical protein ACPKPY_07445 [Nitrososphaeraceae archaeon]
MSTNIVNAEEIILKATGIPNDSLSSEDKKYFYLTKIDLEFSSSSNKICKSDSCIVEIPSPNSVWFLVDNGTKNQVTLYGDFFIRDGVNNDLTQKKRYLVETWNIYDQNCITDIVENSDKNGTTYIFNGKFSFKNKYKNSEVDYEIEGFYILPDRILQIYGTR